MHSSRCSATANLQSPDKPLIIDRRTVSREARFLKPPITDLDQILSGGHFYEGHEFAGTSIRGIPAIRGWEFQTERSVRNEVSSDCS